jgi:hypothetical protein
VRKLFIPMGTAIHKVSQNSYRRYLGSRARSKGGTKSTS